MENTRNYEVELTQLNSRVLDDQDMTQYKKDVKDLGIAIQDEMCLLKHSLAKLHQLFQAWNEAYIDTTSVNKSLEDAQVRYSYLISCESKVLSILKVVD